MHQLLLTILCMSSSAFAVDLTMEATSPDLLRNSDFEIGQQWARGWQRFGNGSFVYAQDDAWSGSRSVILGGSDDALIYQRVPGNAGTQYLVRTWVRHAGGGDSGQLKLEFHDAQGTKIAETTVAVQGAADWQEFSVVDEAPANTAEVTASLLAWSGSNLRFDAVGLEIVESATFLATQPSHPFVGLGTQVWGDQPEAAAQFADLGIRHIRIARDGVSWDEMRALRAVTDPLGIAWTANAWSAPGQFKTNHFLTNADAPGFAVWWVDEVGTWNQEGVRPHFLELMNEPNSGGLWSTGIRPNTYSLLVEATRAELDARGFGSVGIVGPGLAAMSWSNHSAAYLQALSPAAVDGLAAFSSHAWDDGTVCSDGPLCMEQAWQSFGPWCAAVDPAKPIWITEFATKEFTLHGVDYPDPDQTTGYSLASSMPYAARVVANGLALLNAGAESVFYWQAQDRTKAWGYLGLDGTPKPVRDALAVAFGAIALDTEVLEAPDQSGQDLYSAAFASNARVSLILANDDDRSHAIELRLEGALAGMQLESAFLADIATWGDPAQGVGDTSEVTAFGPFWSEETAGSYRLLLTLPRDSIAAVHFVP